MTLILNRSDVLALLRVEDVITAVEQAHIDLAHGRAALPAPASASLGDATFVAMTAASEPAGLATVKLLADLPGRQRSTVLAADTTTGECAAIIDGAVLTRFRTAAATAVATRALARPDARVLGLIGAGPLAEAHAHALSAVHPFSSVVLWGRTPSRSSELAARLQKDLGIKAEVVAGPREVTLASDVLCTLTPSKDPLVKGDWFLPGLHVNAVGAPPRPDHREIDTAGVARARVVVDSYATTMHESGEAVLAVAEGAVTEEHFRLELGDVLAGLEAGRQTHEQITLFNSVGVGLQDLATARLLIDEAVRRGLGTRVDLAA
ncbi:ornithine cyclodeaminase/alanine dehydrogenase [Actinoplanes lutulentus]|uniref:Ornithine cyclodeaminase/alanine dehydrogenase n=1 Tax=Actinoplanes lutulentus TaxID=1287878 RepID=A0A327YY81_9ACTN|nr:ornithine cyclodeaminase family protein [Actinoplanes lutulentus]MBB2943072.1 ornithine cyclodeaminase/alanine dehydrogenase [Actinoplanes lutulentus]RAK26662.1 ornithine cyclodeaminase/alanine dehydrogenase [Actinoplanes lutulentus]